MIQGVAAFGYKKPWAPGFGLCVWVAFASGMAACPVRPGKRRLDPRRGGPPSWLAGMVRAGQAGAGSADNHFPHVVDAPLHGQLELDLLTRLPAQRTHRG